MTSGRFVHYGIHVGGAPVRWRVLSGERTPPHGIVRLVRDETSAMPTQRDVRASDITAWDVQ